MKYTAPLTDMRFVLHDVLQAEQQFQKIPAFEATNRELIDQVLEEAAKFNEQVLLPTNQIGDTPAVKRSLGKFNRAIERASKAVEATLCGVQNATPIRAAETNAPEPVPSRRPKPPRPKAGSALPTRGST